MTLSISSRAFIWTSGYRTINRKKHSRVAVVWKWNLLIIESWMSNNSVSDPGKHGMLTTKPNHWPCSLYTVRHWETHRFLIDSFIAIFIIGGGAWNWRLRPSSGLYEKYNCNCSFFSFRLSSNFVPILISYSFTVGIIFYPLQNGNIPHTMEETLVQASSAFYIRTNGHKFLYFSL